MIKTSKSTKPYSVLAEIYDTLMDDVDYEVWADFIDEIIQRHHHKPRTVLELACGTGSLSFELEKLGGYRITATDKSPRMIEKGRAKAVKMNTAVDFEQVDFLAINMKQRFDVIVSVFDSINYLLLKKDVHRMLSQVQKVMKPHSLFIFDFTTPKNSRESIQFLNNEEGSASNEFRYDRKSRYDTDRQIHYNTFNIKKLADNGKVIERFTEEHQQRPYNIDEIQAIISDSDFTIRAQYSEFDLDEADENSLRITMVLQCKSLITQGS